VIGQTISHYRILEKLGEGGMGVVYKAEDLLYHRNVALKLPPDPFTQNEETRSRFLHEAQMAAGVLHPNVVVMYEVGEHEGHPFLVMEFVDGHTLRTLVEKNGPFPLETWIDVAIQICKGVRAVHRKQMLHRDIKTDNILFSHAEEVKIVDCGLGARFVESEGLAQQLGIAGTTAYMSPEQARGEPIDQRSDIFSIGVVLYEILTGKLPFDADHHDALVYLLTNAEPPKVITLRNDIPASVAAIVQKALEKDPARRYQVIEEILEDLGKVKRELIG
jgi:eukaryotic-like serine/threonine-protein kinase